MGWVLDDSGIDALISVLRADGRTVFGPVVRDGVITHDEIAAASDLPRGWTEEQDGGTYRLEPTGTDERFAYSAPASSWKRFLYPERTLLVRATRTDGRITVAEPAPEAPAAAFFGIRSCDLAGLGVLDNVMLDPDAADPTYAARRPDVFIVAAACNHPGNTCFCASMNTGPSPSSGFDLSLRELLRDGAVEYLVEAGSDRGSAIMAEVSGRPATADDDVASVAAHEMAVGAMGRALATGPSKPGPLDPGHPQWADVASRCLACGNCTMVCPTCFCSTTEETTSLDRTQSERYRVWDSCYSIDFTHLHGGAVRTTTAARYRQWLTHKLSSWHDQFDTSGCVGCGRCISWCPVGIDLTVELPALLTPIEGTP